MQKTTQNKSNKAHNLGAQPRSKPGQQRPQRKCSQKPIFLNKKINQSKCDTPGYVWGRAKFKCSCRFLLHPQNGLRWREFIVAALVGYEIWDFHIWEL